MNKKKSIIALLLNNGLAMMAIFAFIPLIAPLIRELGLEEWQAGLMVAVAGGFWMIFAPIWGRGSDKHGRKNILIAGIFGFFVSYIIMSIFLHYTITTKSFSIITILLFFIFARSFMGVFFGAIPATTAANIADLTSKKNRPSYMAMFGASNSFGIVLGPMFAGLFAGIGLLAPIFAASFLPLIGLFIIMVFLQKAPAKTKDKTNTKSQKLKFSDLRIRLPLITNFLANAGSLTANMCVGYFIMDRFIQSPHEASILLSITLSAAGISTILMQLIMVVLKKVTPLNWIKIGSFMALLSFIALIFMPTKVFFIIAYCFAAAGLAFIMPSALSLASQSVKNTEQGAVSGSMASVQGLANLIVPLISTGIYGFNMFAPFLITASLLGFLLIMTFKKATGA